MLFYFRESLSCLVRFKCKHVKTLKRRRRRNKRTFLPFSDELREVSKFNQAPLNSYHKDLLIISLLGNLLFQKIFENVATSRYDGRPNVLITTDESRSFNLQSP